MELNEKMHAAINLLSHFLATQRAQSIDEDGMCMYRGPDGEKCAAGIFIPDDFDTSLIEGSSIRDAVYGHDKLGDYLVNLLTDNQELHSAVNFLQLCQVYHDSRKGDFDWDEAKFRGLNSYERTLGRNQNASVEELTSIIKDDLLAIMARGIV